MCVSMFLDPFLTIANSKQLEMAENNTVPEYQYILQLILYNKNIKT